MLKPPGWPVVQIFFMISTDLDKEISTKSIIFQINGVKECSSVKRSSG